MGFRPGVEVAELAVPVRVLAALQGLHTRLQAEPGIFEQPAHRHRRYRVPGPAQLARQGAQRLGRPQQRRPGIPAGVGVHQCPQRGDNARVGHIRALAPTTRPARPARLLLPVFQLEHPAGHRRARRARRVRDQAHPAAAALTGFRGHPQAPLPLVQEWRQKLPFARDLGLAISGGDHSTSVGAHNETVALIIGRSLTGLHAQVDADNEYAAGRLADLLLGRATAKKRNACAGSI